MTDCKQLCFTTGEYTHWIGSYCWIRVIRHAMALTAVNPQHEVQYRSPQKKNTIKYIKSSSVVLHWKLHLCKIPLMIIISQYDQRHAWNSSICDKDTINICWSSWYITYVLIYLHALSELTKWSQAIEYPQGYCSAGAALTSIVGKAVHNPNSSLCYALSYRNGQVGLLVDNVELINTDTITIIYFILILNLVHPRKTTATSQQFTGTVTS